MNHPDPTAETLPNPYRFTVTLSFGEFSKCWFVNVAVDALHDHMIWSFPTKEEADTHAALILAALHEAVIE